MPAVVWSPFRGARGPSEDRPTIYSLGKQGFGSFETAGSSVKVAAVNEGLGGPERNTLMLVFRCEIELLAVDRGYRWS